MKAIKQQFKPSIMNSKNTRIMAGLLIVLVLLLSFGSLRDNDTLITHEQANVLYSKDKIEKLILDGEYIRLQTESGNYKIYKEAINPLLWLTFYF